MFDTHLHKKLDWPLLVVTYFIAALGLMILYSTTRFDPSAAYKKQAIGLALGTVALIAASYIDFHVYPRFTRHLYILNILALILVLKKGKAVNGAVRWINIAGFPFQPSEFAKLLIILTLAVFLARHYETIRTPKTLFLSFLYILFPMALIFKQPDLGTTLVILAIWFGMVYIAGAKLAHLSALVVVGAVLFAGMWHFDKIKTYQKHRITAYLNPEADQKETGYHVYQARIAIGSGGMWGKGLLRSTQVRGGYIPEKQTDFVFTDVGEELGFVGAVSIALLYAVLLLRGALIIAASDEDILGKLVAAGIVTMIGFHVIVNIGMVIGILPVAGVPLPLFSAGNSNVLVTMTCIGLLQSIALHRHQFLF